MKIDRKLRHASHTTIFSLLRSIISGFTRGHGSSPGKRRKITRQFAPICGAAMPRPYPVVSRQYASVSARSSTSAPTAGAVGSSTFFAISRNPGSPNCNNVRIAASFLLCALPRSAHSSTQSGRLRFILILSSLSFVSVSSASKSPPVFPTSPIPPTGTQPQSPPYSQSHLPAAQELRSPHESPAKTRPLARYIGCKSELLPSLLRSPGRLSRHQQEFRTAGRSAH